MELYFISLVIFLVSMIGSPGPANMIMLASGLKFGFKRSLPFVFGVIISKQFIIWPISLGVINISNISPTVHEVMKYVAAVAARKKDVGLTIRRTTTVYIIQ